MKNVQIPFDLFLALLSYHLLDNHAQEAKIQAALSKKLDALALRELYTQYKTAPTEEEREKARQAYLNQQGILPGFRW